MKYMSCFVNWWLVRSVSPSPASPGCKLHIVIIPKSQDFPLHTHTHIHVVSAHCKFGVNHCCHCYGGEQNLFLTIVPGYWYKERSKCLYLWS